MPALEITNNSTVDVVLFDVKFREATVTFAGAGTLLAGTILARDTTTLKMVPFVKGGTTNGNGVPSAVLREELTATGAGDLVAWPIISGDVRLSHLVIDADGDASNVDGAVIDQLRDYTIIATDTTELSELDNQ